MRTFVFQDEKSHKFWNIDLQDTQFVVTFGKVGTNGQTQTKEFDDAAKALKAHDKLVAEKVKKGYVETTPQLAPPPSPLQQSMETALLESPDDLATHSAYADYLMEHGDPRGEFIQVQLRLENKGLPAAERTRLRQRERDLLTQYARRWCGDAGRFLVGDWSGPDRPYHYEFRRGWLDQVRVLPAPEAILTALAQAPECRLLRRLEIVYDMRYHPFDFDEILEGPNAALRTGENENELYESANILPPLLASPYLANLRVFKLGFSDDRPENLVHSTMISLFEDCTADQVITLLGKCPRIEELYLNTTLSGIERLFALPGLENLRVLQYYYASDYSGDLRSAEYPLAALANNASLGNLTTLRLHAGRDATVEVDQMDAILRSSHLPALTHLQVHMTTFGDEGARRIIRSGALRRLKHLDIGYGNLTDAGARLLADCADLKHLDLLDVTRNALTPEGIAALEGTGVRIVAEGQHEADNTDYLYEVDVE